MGDAEADIAEALSNDGWLTVLDGPLHEHPAPPRPASSASVKTHHRRMLAREHWVRVPELTFRGTVGPLRDEGRSLRLLPARG